MRPRTSDGGTNYQVGSGSKKIKKGFKQDRRKNFWDRVKSENGATGNTGKKSKSRDGEEVQHRPKAITFDEKERKDFLLGLHKRKNERRVDAVIQRKKKHRKDQSKLRRELREEARQQYNTASAVPILPDYTFQFPDFEGEEDEEDEDYDEEENGNKKKKKMMKKKQKSKKMIETSETTHDVGIDGNSIVTVSVQPLINKQQQQQQQYSSIASENYKNSKNKNKNNKNDQNDTNVVTRADAGLSSDLPASLQQRLARLKKEQKGETQPKIRVRQVRELKKLAKINKHCKKGAGKKSKSGKRKNR